MGLLQAHSASCPYTRYDTRYDRRVLRNIKSESESFTSSDPFITCPQPYSPHHVIAFTLKKHMDLCFFCPTHTQRSSSYFHSIPLEPLTGRPPLTINLTLAPTLPFSYFSFFGSFQV